MMGTLIVDAPGPLVLTTNQESSGSVSDGVYVREKPVKPQHPHPSALQHVDAGISLGRTVLPGKLETKSDEPSIPTPSRVTSSPP